jgi:hypothetical protein
MLQKNCICILLTYLIFISEHSSAQVTCSDYLQLHQQLRCPEKGYLYHFAYPICLKFSHSDVLNAFTPREQTVLASIKTCLLEKLKVIPSPLNCSKVRNVSLRTHPYCYQQSGFCGLALRSRQKILRLLKPYVKTSDVLLWGLKTISQCHKTTVTYKK